MGRAERAQQRSEGEAPRDSCRGPPARLPSIRRDPPGRDTKDGVQYLQFEGTLPENDYGAGEVIVWDFGEFEAVGPEGDDALAALREGVLRFDLYGTKLRGQWVILKTKMGGGKRENWLWQKNQDEFAQPDYDPETEPASALSGKIPSGKR